jgi:tetratricopeptide (TPR) repeat protein
MHAERDYLRDVVFPELAERLRQRRHYLEPIDLRLGVEIETIAEEQARELQVLKVCLDEIERSRPFLLVLLGDRYGWTPPEERIARAALEAGFDTETAGKSVTALEIEFGILKKDPDQRQRCLFYLRQPLPYAQMSPELAAVYSDEHSPDPQVRAGYARLQALKHRIARDEELAARVRHYGLGWDIEEGRVTGLEAWGRQVLEALWDDLEAETAAFARQAPATWEAEEREALNEFIELKARDFRGRRAVMAQALTLAEAEEDGVWGLCLTGEPGSGKSALFARLYRHSSASSPPAESAAPSDAPLLLAHAAGSTPRSGGVGFMLRRWVLELATFLGEPSPLAEDAGMEEVEKAFSGLLHRASARRRVVVLVDALNQFEPTPRARYVTWLPKPWPANARLIATAVPGPEVEALTRRAGVEPLALPPLDEAEAAEISRAVWARHHRQINPEVLRQALGRSRADGEPAYANPLWLTLAMEQLNLLDADDFDRAGQNLHDLLLEITGDLPPDIDGLFADLLGRAEKRFGLAWTMSFASLVALSRAGWREADLRELLPAAARLLLPESPPPAWDPLQFAALRRSFRGQVIQRGSHGRWDFTHLQMRAAMAERYLADPALVQRLHRAVADHLLALPLGDPLGAQESMHHLIGGDDRLRAARFYASLPTPLGEPSEATRTLALHILAAGEAEPNPGLAWTLSLLTQPGLTADRIHDLGNRLQFDLNDALANEARLGLRLLLLEAVRQSLERLAASDPSKTSWQRDLSVSENKVGDVLRAQGDLSGALRSYRAGLVIRERLAASDPSNASWQRDLSVSHDRVGDVLRAQGDLSGALRSYRAGLVIRERLAGSDPSNASWQRDLWVSYWRVAATLERSGDRQAAVWWTRAYQTLSAMKRAGLFISPGDERVYLQLKQKLGY